MIVGKKEHRDKILDKFRHWDLEATVVGEVTDDGNYTLIYTEKGKEKTEVMKLSDICGDIYEEHELKPWVTQHGEYRKASKATTNGVWRQYDWRVGARTLKGPNQPGRYAVLDLEEIGKDLVISWSSDEGRSDQDPVLGINYAFDKAYGYIKGLGAKPLGLTNCLNFGNPWEAMDVFNKTVEGLAKRSQQFDVPVVSGNVSLYNGNAYARSFTSIKPTPVLVMVGVKNK